MWLRSSHLTDTFYSPEQVSIASRDITNPTSIERDRGLDLFHSRYTRGRVKGEKKKRIKILLGESDSSNDNKDTNRSVAYDKKKSVHFFLEKFHGEIKKKKKNE